MKLRVTIFRVYITPFPENARPRAEEKKKHMRKKKLFIANTQEKNNEIQIYIAVSNSLKVKILQRVEGDRSSRLAETCNCEGGRSRWWADGVVFFCRRALVDLAADVTRWGRGWFREGAISLLRGQMQSRSSLDLMMRSSVIPVIDEAPVLLAEQRVLFAQAH